MTESIQSILTNFPLYLNTIIEIIGALTLLATLVTKLTPSPNDDVAVAGFKLKFHKLLAWLPTLGYNAHQDAVGSKKESKDV